MPLHVKNAGAWKPVKKIWVKDAGVWKPVRRGFVRDAGAWKQYFQDEVPHVLTDYLPQVNAQNLFLPEDWANPILNKRIVIPATMGMWSYTVGVAALNTGTGRGGKLIIDNAGDILGAGGLPNGGEGGFAMYVPQSGVIINNSGLIGGGGGGGGLGGQGGPGYYEEPYTYTEAFGDPNTGYYWIANGGNWVFVWNYETIYSGPTPAYSTGGWTYQPGSLWSGSNYTANRSQTRYTPNYTTGGLGGQGGHGTGYNSSLTVLPTTGAAGAAGGTNAGTGGKGGNGGSTWGQSGATGNAGAAGNNGSGSAGSAGGLPGHYIYGISQVETLINTGSLLGRVI